MIERHDDSLADIIDDTDITSVAYTTAFIRKKIIPFFERHTDHHPLMCPYSHPSFIETANAIAEHLEVLLEAHNEYRKEQGLDPLVTFVDGTAAVVEKEKGHNA